MKKEKRIIRIETLEDLPISIDTKDIEWEIVPGSKYGERMAESNLHCKVNHPKVMAPDLPPLPEGAVPLEASDWAGTWTVRKRTGEIMALVDGISYHSGAVFTSIYKCIYPDELMTDYERARGWPGDPDLEWTECWKWADETEG